MRADGWSPAQSRWRHAPLSIVDLRSLFGRIQIAHSLFGAGMEWGEKTPTPSSHLPACVNQSREHPYYLQQACPINGTSQLPYFCASAASSTWHVPGMCVQRGSFPFADEGERGTPERITPSLASRLTMLAPDGPPPERKARVVQVRPALSQTLSANIPRARHCSWLLLSAWFAKGLAYLHENSLSWSCGALWFIISCDPAMFCNCQTVITGAGWP